MLERGGSHKNSYPPPHTHSSYLSDEASLCSLWWKWHLWTAYTKHIQCRWTTDWLIAHKKISSMWRRRIQWCDSCQWSTAGNIFND